MLITCPSCSTSYQVAPAALGAAGRSVRCVRCQSVWFAMPAEEQESSVEDARSLAETNADAGDDTWSDAFAGLSHSEPGAEAPGPEVTGGAGSSGVDFGFGPAETSDGPVTISDAPSVVPGQAPGGVALDGNGAGEDIETFAARRMAAQRRRSRKPKLLGLPALILVLVALNAAVIGWREQVVKILPQTASLFAAVGLPVNLRGLAFEHVVTTKESQDGIAILAVDGKIVGTSRRPVEVPRLRFAVRNASGHEIYTWTALPARSVLGPGETLPFRSRLASPPPETKDVVVRFFSRHDVVDAVR